MQPTFRRAAVLDLLLNRDNPRHVNKENQEDVIEYLLESEEVYNLARHLTTGAWVFVETLTALHGRSVEFVGYLNGKFGAWGIGKEKGKNCKLSLEYISQNGNATISRRKGLFV